ncbi:MAG: tRNA preQ1(34) S-adenosylmethionine ribosyltransferase-isomerase QueA [Bacillota bacterium]|nr:tRNA preQ1(34) S-adenosylmethionine ribosyltransferase-isomerase QueA [Bacillota bacterium]
MKLDAFDYYLPENRIAQKPAAKRDQSKLLVLSKNNGTWEDKIFSQITEYFNCGDVLVINETKVIPARLFGQRATGGRVEIFLLKRLHDDVWETLVRPGKRVRVGDTISFADPNISCAILDTTESGGRIVEFHYEGIWEERLDNVGTMPLPPYIHDYQGDMGRYQTVYANIPGSVAAPTAGLHFTPELLATLEEKGVKIAKVNLSVGLGTFRPVEVENIEDHKMHEEFYEIDSVAAATVNEAKANGGRVISVGTTSTRVLETVGSEKGYVEPCRGWTDAYIYPGYKYKVIDGLITNFHLPKSSLLMLVSALAGRENVLRAYEHAVNSDYRFFSFGDAMLII